MGSCSSKIEQQKLNSSQKCRYSVSRAVAPEQHRAREVVFTTKSLKQFSVHKRGIAITTRLGSGRVR